MVGHIVLAVDTKGKASGKPDMKARTIIKVCGVFFNLATEPVNVVFPMGLITST